jgi:hypothetical protein
MAKSKEGRRPIVHFKSTNNGRHGLSIAIPVSRTEQMENSQEIGIESDGESSEKI